MSKTYIPDLRTMVPRKEHLKIYERAKKRETQEEVGKILGVPRRTISAWENGSNGNVAKASIPDLRTIVPRKELPKIYGRAKKGEIPSGGGTFRK